VKTSTESESRKRNRNQFDPASDIATDTNTGTSKTSNVESHQPTKLKPQASWRDTLPSKAEIDEGRQVQAQLLKLIKEEQAREAAEASCMSHSLSTCHSKLIDYSLLVHPLWSFVAPPSPAPFISAPKMLRMAAFESIKPRVWTSVSVFQRRV
jgi:hypothetical protein